MLRKRDLSAVLNLSIYLVRIRDERQTKGAHHAPVVALHEAVVPCPLGPSGALAADLCANVSTSSSSETSTSCGETPGNSTTIEMSSSVSLICSFRNGG